MSNLQTRDSEAPLFVGDDLALDFINTAFGIGDAKHDYLDSDAQVLDWLRAAGLPHVAPVADGSLLEAALALRKIGRGLVEKREKGGDANPADLNRVLALGSSYQALVWKKGSIPTYERRQRVVSAEALLVPVAEAMARLLAEGDFDLVRKCESPNCTLWFYDKTKSHHRRWCSMAACGNRMKVAAFRERRQLREAKGAPKS